MNIVYLDGDDSPKGPDAVDVPSITRSHFVVSDSNAKVNNHYRRSIDEKKYTMQI